MNKKNFWVIKHDGETEFRYSLDEINEIIKELEDGTTYTLFYYVYVERFDAWACPIKKVITK